MFVQSSRIRENIVIQRLRQVNIDETLLELFREGKIRYSNGAKTSLQIFICTFFPNQPMFLLRNRLGFKYTTDNFILNIEIMEDIPKSN